MSLDDIGIHWLGLIGTALVVIAYVPQITHLMMMRCGDGVSLGAYALWCSASSLLCVYAVIAKEPIFIALQGYYAAACSPSGRTASTTIHPGDRGQPGRDLRLRLAGSDKASPQRTGNTTKITGLAGRHMAPPVDQHGCCRTSVRPTSTNYETIDREDFAMRGMLASLGIVKGQPFKPDPKMKTLLDKAGRWDLRWPLRRL